MRMRSLWGLLALALVAAASATTSTSADVAPPTLILVQRAPLVVRGTHFKGHEAVSLRASSGAAGAVARLTATARGRFVASFAHFAVPSCVRVVVHAAGSRGDRATLVIDPKPGPTGIPCGV